MITGKGLAFGVRAGCDQILSVPSRVTWANPAASLSFGSSRVKRGEQQLSPTVGRIKCSD